MIPEGQKAPFLPALLAALSAAVATSIGAAALSLFLGSFSSASIGALFGFVTFILAMPIATTHALLLGLPVYFLLRRSVRLSYPNAAFAGFVIGAVPVALHLYSLNGAPYLPESTIARDLLQRAYTGSLCGAAGAFGGVVFRRALKLFERNEVEL